MNEDHPVIKTIRQRRSVRKYRSDDVPPHLLELIVDCGRMAPSSRNAQAWEFVVVTDRAKLQAMADVSTYGKFIAQVSACIVVCGDPSHRSLYLDGAAATQNMLLAIHALGLASCWVQAFEKDYAPVIKELIGLPPKLALVSMVPVGYAEVTPTMPRKRSLNEVLHWNTFRRAST